MDIKQLNYFHAIVEEGQITGAAKRLHISQPPLSYQLKMLEKELGIKLIERGSRRIRLTDAGKIFYDRAEQILNLTNATVKEMKDIEEGQSGTLSMGTVSSSGSIIFTEKMKKFHEIYPNINFEIYEGNTFKILELLNKGLIEIGVVRSPFDIHNLNFMCLPKEPMIAAMSDKFDTNKKNRTIHIEDLEGKPIILYRRFEKLINDAFLKNRCSEKIFCKNDDARTSLLWAEAGLGIAIVPESAFKLISPVNLTYKIIDEESLITQIYAIWAKNRYMSPASKSFLKVFSNK